MKKLVLGVIALFSIGCTTQPMQVQTPEDKVVTVQVPPIIQPSNLRKVEGSGLLEGQVHYGFEKTVSGQPVLLNLTVIYRTAAPSIAALGVYDKYVKFMTDEVVKSGFHFVSKGEEMIEPSHDQWDYRLSTTFTTTNGDDDNPELNTVGVQLYTPANLNGHLYDGTPISIAGFRSYTVFRAMQAIEQRMKNGGSITDYIK